MFHSLLNWRRSTRLLFGTMVLLGIVGLLPGVANADEPPSLLVIVGAGGTAEYEAEFTEAAKTWQTVGETASLKVTTIGLESASKNDHDAIHDYLAANPASTRLWIVLIGHGTSYRETAKFNLRGPDVSAKEFQEWLDAVNRPLAIINCSSSSGPFLKTLSKPGRVVITATKSGAEQNYARFGKYLSMAIADKSADLDHDDQISLLEAYLTAAKNTQKFYDDDARLATEHALLDDNGDGLGTPADFFQGIRATKKAQGDAKPDGSKAHQFILLTSSREKQLSTEAAATRDKLEVEIETLLNEKRFMNEDEYYAKLEKIMVEMAMLYRGQ